ncbi:MAG: hypothetical protein NC038_06975 [Paludibacter sp.]|nr:hypothetical protein [Bacteroidales bacterium]MCM1069643.1 hypothetical protein [Prevotella sp.]MCM1354289.1 hypothetical protein [Bacteroides sp.]MCM1443128.1 hypothetical protein [Muribaculum sp.]MCM1482363.1 hypothetical protein [Paludibacter sp.]
MKQLRLFCTTLFIVLVSVVSAQMQLWRNGRIMMETDPLLVDSVTFVAPQMLPFACTFEWESPFSLSIVPENNDVDYIWVATSDDDYAYYGYTSYEEAWQTTVDIAQMYGALEEWNMIVRGRSAVDLSDPTFMQTHYVLTVAAWQNGQRSSEIRMYSFTLTEEGGIPDVVAQRLSEKGTSVSMMQFWTEGEIVGNIALNNIDSITFKQPEPEPLFYLEVSEITNISFKATIVPVDEEMLYFADYVPASVADTYTDNDFAQAYLGQLLERWKYYYPNSTFEEAFLYKGIKNLRFNEGLMGNTDYYLVCFAVDTTNYTLASGLYKVPFTTEPTPTNPDLTFSVTLNESNNIVTITPSDNTSTYYWGYYGPSEVEKYGTPQEAWKVNAAKYGRDYSSHGEDRFSIGMQAMETGLHYLVIGGYDGMQTTTLFVWEFTVTDDMLPF